MATIDVRVALSAGHTPVVVSAEIYGPFAIHKTLLAIGGLGDTFTLTHVRTGYAIASSISHTQALRLARKLVGARLNWKFATQARAPKRTMARGAEIVKAFLVQERGW